MRINAGDTIEAFTGPTMNPHVDPAHPVLAMSELDLQEAIIELAVRLKYSAIYHTHDSRRSPAGFPDLVLVHPKRKRTIFAEIKAHKGRLSNDQIMWLQALADAGNHVHLWRPGEWLTGSIERELRGPRI